MKFKPRTKDIASPIRAMSAAILVGALVLAIGAIPILTVLMATASRASGAIAALPESLATPPLPQRAVLLDA